jgi:hypothetical protein
VLQVSRVQQEPVSKEQRAYKVSKAIREFKGKQVSRDKLECKAKQASKGLQESREEPAYRE